MKEQHDTAQAASSAVLKAIREANMQLVRTGDNAFMLVPYKVATVQAAESVQDLQSVNDAVTIELLNERVEYLEGKQDEALIRQMLEALDSCDPGLYMGTNGSDKPYYDARKVGAAIANARARLAPPTA